MTMIAPVGIPPLPIWRDSRVVVLDQRGRICITPALRAAIGDHPLLYRVVGHALLLAPAACASLLDATGHPHLRSLVGVGVGQSWTSRGNGTGLLIPRPLRDWANLTPFCDVRIEGLPSGGVLICEAGRFSQELLLANQLLLADLALGGCRCGREGC